MRYFADLHIHSRFSRATSKSLTVRELDLWARKKGIAVLGTGDFTHPEWTAEIKEEFIPAPEERLFVLKDAKADDAPRFLPSVEISSIYSKNGKVRRIHNLVTVPNLDWGQDLKRLAQFVEKRGVDRIAIDYFGWTPPTYYIKTAEVIPWDVGKGQPSGWFAVSATFKQQACAQHAPGFVQDTTRYCFLNNYKPVEVIGGSIYVYYLP